MNMTYVFKKQTALTAYWSEDGMLTRSTHAFIVIICLVDVADIAMAAPISQQIPPGNLVYDAQTQGAVPIPPSERNLQTVLAKPWFKASNVGLILEAVIFDRNDNVQSAGLAIRPDTNDLDAEASDGAGSEDASVFHAEAFAHGLPKGVTK